MFLFEKNHNLYYYQNFEQCESKIDKVIFSIKIKKKGKNLSRSECHKFVIPEF